MGDNFYNSEYKMYCLIEEMDRLSNTKYREKLGYNGEMAPYIYMNGKCYYFARALNSVVKEGKLYMIADPLHIILKVGKNFWDARGMLFPGDSEYDPRDATLLDLNNPEDIYRVSISVANSNDDKNFYPVLLDIAKEADENVRSNFKKESMVR